MLDNLTPLKEGDPVFVKILIPALEWRPGVVVNTPKYDVLGEYDVVVVVPGLDGDWTYRCYRLRKSLRTPEEQALMALVQ